MKQVIRALIAAAFALSSTPALSMNLLEARYDPATDEIVFKIAYRGSHPDHAFTVAWETCRTMGSGRKEILGVILDSDPNDPARADHEKTVRIDLSAFTCRPATVFLGLPNQSQRQTLTIPERAP